MHESSLLNMVRMRDKHLGYLNTITAPKVCDVGGIYNQPAKTYLRLFEHLSGLQWHICDIVKHSTVTDWMSDPLVLPFGDGTFDLVVSGQMLEHCQNPFRMVAEMCRVLKQGCMMVIIVPSAGPRHDKQDGWRFMDDAFRFIVKHVPGIEVVADYMDRSSHMSDKWRDHVFVGRKV